MLRALDKLAKIGRGGVIDELERGEDAAAPASPRKKPRASSTSPNPSAAESRFWSGPERVLESSPSAG